MSTTKQMLIETHTFEHAKESLIDLFNEADQVVSLSAVATEGFIPLFDHNVTGRELNRVIGQLEDTFISLNSRHERVTAELWQVYLALEALDDDYISAIVQNMNSIEKTSSDAKKIAEKTQEHSHKLEKTIETQKKTIEALVKLKDDLQLFHEENAQLKCEKAKIEEEIAALKFQQDDLGVKTVEDVMNLATKQKKQLKSANMLSACAILMSVASVALHFMG